MLKEIVGAIINILPIKNTPSEQETRFKICESCEHLVQPDNICDECGCFMDVKTSIKSASCPIKKW